MLAVQQGSVQTQDLDQLGYIHCKPELSLDPFLWMLKSRTFNHLGLCSSSPDDQLDKAGAQVTESGENSNTKKQCGFCFVGDFRLEHWEKKPKPPKITYTKEYTKIPPLFRKLM